MSNTDDLSLAARHCVPCRGGVPPLTPDEQEPLLKGLNGWQVIAGHLCRDFKFDNFVDALAFAAKLGEIAEKENHHPEITIGWGHARVEVWTHKIDGLAESDFILAAKCDASYLDQ